MRVRSFWGLAPVVACLAGALPNSACGNTPSSGAPPPSQGGGDDAGDAAQDQTNPMEGGMPDGSTGEAGADSAGPGDAAGDSGRHDGAGADGAGLDATMDAMLTVDAPPPGPEGGVLCPQGETWAAPVTVLTTAAADSTIFGSVTPDELTLAWASSTGGVVTAWYADRTSTGQVFGAPQALAATFGALSLDHVSLSGDGLRIVGVASNSAGFVAAKRAARTGPFNTDDSAEFSGITAGEGTHGTYATPLLSPDNALFFYIMPSSTSNQVVFESPGGPPWNPGAYLNGTQLQRVGTQYRRPSGISMDEYSLFFWDETSSTEYIAYRATPNSDFNLFVNLGALTNAVPTATCSRLYYSIPAGTPGAITIVYTDGTAPDD